MIKDCFNCKYSHLYDEEVLRCNLKNIETHEDEVCEEWEE